MNRHVVRALFEDAFRQVLDDKVFRLLVVLAIVLILPTFLVGFRPEGITLLFGWKVYPYSDLTSAFGGAGGAQPPDVHILFIRGLQDIVVQGLAGTVGILFCIAATAFFVPRMLEKGAADTLFSRPVGRFTLLLARYLTGVLFVAVLSFLLVLGMHVGFLVVSGWSDTAFLWSALTLTYVFALVHSVSVAVAVFTRSSIAAILTTLLFFAFTGCVQQGWISVEHRNAVRSEAVARGESEIEGTGRFQFLKDLLDGLHWTLPKTTDADFIVAGLRKSLTESDPALKDSNGQLSVIGTPDGFQRDGTATADLGAEPAVWIAREASGLEKARIELTRRSRRDADVGDGSSPTRPTTSGSSGPIRLRAPGSYSLEDSKALEGDPATVGKPVRSSRPGTEGLSLAWVRWRTRGESAEVHHARGYTGIEDTLYVIDATFQPEFGAEDDRDRALDRFLDELRVERKSAANMNSQDWYTRTFGFGAPWRHNAFVSIGTSLLFAVVLLLIARWRLARIDF
jgi:ABC-type transport system involved in multi-copper enzyme maturation permease subunit